MNVSRTPDERFARLPDGKHLIAAAHAGAETARAEPFDAIELAPARLWLD